MANLEKLANVLAGLDTNKLSVHPERCVRVRHRLAECNLCAMACTSSAIKIDAGGGGLTIEPSLCVGCGSCAVACPTEALFAKSPTSEEILADSFSAVNEDGIVYFACPKAADKKQYNLTYVSKIPCISRVDETVLIGLAVAGAKEARLVTGKCEKCEAKSGYDLAQLTVPTANYLLECFGKKLIGSFVDKLPEEYTHTKMHGAEAGNHGGVSRRGFFTQMKNGVQNTAYGFASDTIPALFPKIDEDGVKVDEVSLVDKLRVSADGKMVQHRSHQRTRLLSYLDLLGEPKVDKVFTYLWGRIEIDSTICKSCRMCSTFCPTGAIWRVNNDGAWGIAHLPADCVQCRLCETACFRNALTVHEDVSLTSLLNCEVDHHKMEEPTKNKGAFAGIHRNK